MDRFNIKPGRGRKAFAGLICVTALFPAIHGPLSARFLAAGMFLSAYDLAFIPSPPLNVKLSDIYAMARKGWRMSWTSKILSAVSWVLLVTSFYLLWQGR